MNVKTVKKLNEIKGSMPIVQMSAIKGGGRFASSRPIKPTSAEFIIL